MLPSTPYATAADALGALADQHDTHGPSVFTRARITRRGGRKVNLYISRQGRRIVGSHRTGGQYGSDIGDIDQIERIEYGQGWLRDERGPLFVREG
jgi:hypothetical protein